MKFNYEYRTSDNVAHTGSVCATNREAAFAKLKAISIRPSRLVEAPGIVNKVWGKGKRWMLIGLLGCVATISLFFNRRASDGVDAIARGIQNETRRQIMGDAAIISEGVRTGWANVFDDEGDRFLASFAIPGIPAAVRNTTEEKVVAALGHEVGIVDGDSVEARQIKSIVSGMKKELRDFLRDGGTVAEYGSELVRRQDVEIEYYQRAKREIDVAIESGVDKDLIYEMAKDRNVGLRKLGIKLVVFDE